MSSSLELRSISLRVRDLAGTSAFYRRLGFVDGERPVGTDTVDLTTPHGAATLRLVGAPSAAAAPRDTAGLFHAALLLPSRAALGRWLKHAAEAGVALQGFSDHGVSEAIYFADPEGNGLEFYADRPRDAWPRRDGKLAMTTLPLDLPALLSAGTSLDADGLAAGPPLAGARWGHLHLRVTGLERSTAFYREQLGLEVTQGDFPGARFLAADGYHHHLGLNTWGAPRRAQPAGAPGLAEAVFARRDGEGPATGKTLHDPDGIALRIVAPAESLLQNPAG